MYRRLEKTMTIDIETERTISLTEAAKSLPGRPHVSTLWRWVREGRRGVRLETVAVGGRRFTSREALRRFVDRVSASHDSEFSSPKVADHGPSDHRRRTANEVLDRDGVK